MRPKRRWLLYWIVGFGVLAFGVPEAVALLDPEPGDTLSESLRYVTSSTFGALLFLGFIAWFVWHILIQRRKDRR